MLLTIKSWVLRHEKSSKWYFTNSLRQHSPFKCHGHEWTNFLEKFITYEMQIVEHVNPKWPGSESLFNVPDEWRLMLQKHRRLTLVRGIVVNDNGNAMGRLYLKRAFFHHSSIRVQMIWFKLPLSKTSHVFFPGYSMIVGIVVWIFKVLLELPACYMIILHGYFFKSLLTVYIY